MNRFSQLIVLENVHDCVTDATKFLRGQCPGNEEGVQEKEGDRRAIPEGQTGRQVVPWCDREQEVGRPASMHIQKRLN